MTWESAERAAYGALRMSSLDFWEETPREFALRLQGHAQATQAVSREHWEQTRILAYYMAAPHLKQSMSITKFFPFEWDRERQERPKLTDEQLRELMKKLDKWQPLATS